MTKNLDQYEKRETYRHGDLRRALLEAAVDLARKGGKDAIVLREVTRRAGVAPNAAYRHFKDLNSLLVAAAMAAQAELATYMERELANLKPMRDSTENARAQLRAVGTGYLKFAQAEPGLFRLAFSENADLSNAANPESTGSGGLTPFQLLSAALDSLVEAGDLPKERREAAEFFAWSAVHGLAVLIIDGPLRGLEKKATETIGQRLIDMVERGL
ncbi:MAG TPA: TetR/AcrR family transcriptional regulator [Methylophilaceae bacterium]|nr:TetR/AcrR family transcriptional regulator [Methylophilaceae bacterium]